MDVLEEEGDLRRKRVQSQFERTPRRRRRETDEFRDDLWWGGIRDVSVIGCCDRWC